MILKIIYRENRMDYLYIKQNEEKRLQEINEETIQKYIEN